MITHIFAALIYCSLAFQPIWSVLGLEQEYDNYMNTWTENIILARNFLDKAQESLNNGDPLESCFNQRKASEYGLIATQSRIKAEEIQGDLSLIPNLEEGLKKWKAFADFCR